MALSITSIGNYLFKRAQGKSSTNDGRQFFEEPINGRANVFPSQVWALGDQIPATAPTLADQAVSGVVKRWVNLQLSAVPGVANSFSHASLVDCIPFNFGDGTSYNYALSDSTGAAIPFGQGDWIVDPATGTVTFYTSTPANMPPKISFYQYVGAKGLASQTPNSITFTEQTSDPATPASGFDVLYFKTGGILYSINSAGTIRQIATLAGAETLTNKTLAAPSVNGQVVDIVNYTDQSADPAKPAAGLTTLYTKGKALFQIDSTGLVKQLATLTGTETLTNKTLTAPIADVISYTDQSAAPTTPASGATRIYTKSGQLYKLTPDGTETLVGAGAGVLNYITNGDFEQGATPLPQYATVTLTNGLPSGTPTLSSTAGSFTLSYETSATLRGTRSLKMLTTSGFTAGQGFPVASAFTVANADLGKVLTVSLDYGVVLGAGNLQYSGRVGSQSLGLAVFDVTANAFVPSPAGALGFTSNFLGTVSATFQASSVVGQQYQLYIFNLLASTGQTTVLFDNFLVNRQAVVNGAAITDYQSYTPSLPGFGTVTNLNARWRRNGSRVEVIGVFNAGTTTTTTAQVSLPVGLVTASATQGGYPVGSAARSNTAASNSFVLLGNPNSSAVNFGLLSTSGTSPTTSQQGSAIVASGDAVLFQFSVEIQGWSSNVQVSSDADTRIFAASLSTLTSTAQTANTPFKYTTTTFDTHGTSVAANGTIGAAVSGYHLFMGSGYGTAGTASDLAVYVNGALRVNRIVTVSTSGRPSFCVPLLLNAGDLVSLVPLTTFTAADTNGTIGLVRVTGPSVIAATESVNATYGMTTSQSVAANAVVKYDTVRKDTHLAYSTSTGLLTVPVSMQLRISLTGNASAAATLYVRVNGTAVANVCTVNASSTAGSTISIAVQAGQTVGIYSDSAVTINGSGTNGFVNQVTFERTGN